MRVSKTAVTHSFSLYVTGEGIEEAVQDYCNEMGLCVTVTKTNYIFTGGSEEGYIIGLINYPRFPTKEWELKRIATNLGVYLIGRCNPNGSFTLQGDRMTEFWSNRPGD